MKKSLPYAVVLVLFLGFVGVNSIKAQNPILLNVNVPFEFKAGDKLLPAGNYEVTRNVSSGDNVLLVRKSDGSASSLIQVITRISGRDTESGEVVFDKVGDSYYLAELFVPGSDGYDLPGARPQKHSHYAVKGTKGQK